MIEERTKAEEAVDRALSRFALKSPTEAVGRRDMAVLDAAIRIALRARKQS